MEEIFQNSVKSKRETELRRSGVLSAKTFDDFSQLRAFLPSQQLRPFVSHYWIVRWNIPEGITYKPTEVLSRPVVNIFFMPDEAFVYGLTTEAFEYEAKARGVMAGATFTYGGFYPFWGKSMSELPTGKTPLKAIFPECTPAFSRELTAIEDDEEIAQRIEAVLERTPVQQSPHLQTLHSIIDTISSDSSLRSSKEVSKHFRIPERTLQLLFQREVGVSLKWVTMRARLLEVAARASAEAKPDWAATAADLGYSSQGHFIADFKRATGQTPASFHKTVA